MKGFKQKYVSISSSFHPLYYVCKIVGLAPFCFTVSSDKGVEIDINIHSNIVGVSCSLLIICMLLGGTLCYFPVLASSRNPTPHFITSFMISFPLTVLMALLAITMNLTVNRHKFGELSRKLNDIDRALLKYGVSKRNVWSNIEMVLLLLILIPWLCVDGWLWTDRMGFVGEATLRLSHLVQILVIIQFCKLTQFVWQSSKFLNKALRVSVRHDYERYRVIEKEFLNNPCSNMSSVNIISMTRRLPRTHNFPIVENVFQRRATDKPKAFLNLLEIRCIYGNIYEAVGFINSIYGLSVLLELVRNVLTVIVNILQTMEVLKKPSLYGRPSLLYASLGVLWIVFLISREVAIAVSCHMATSEAKKIQDNVQCTLLRQHLRTETLEQLKLFSTQLTVNRIEFSAFGFFTLNLSTLSTFLVSVITYIVVLEQIK
ncbi:hypothetical protein L798_08354 [Zootermopsis nevadensis]|uniref:Gustatory receptor n=1 Tax=Zootermopsis nevadensis TaxID=136037 RepID=A0A067R3D3_ZOONE|nr:hypothetical protein L798_08354 [Zootermopsis nevadensis]